MNQQSTAMITLLTVLTVFVNTKSRDFKLIFSLV